MVKVSEDLFTSSSSHFKFRKRKEINLCNIIDSLNVLAVILVIILLEANTSCLATTLGNSRPTPIFSNQFALYIPSGDDKANEIATKYGYQNHGQIGPLKNYYLFVAHKIHKRSIEPNEEHHQLLTNDMDIHWFEQQIEKKRVKRDFSYVDGGSGGFFSASGGAFPSQKPLGRFPDPLYTEQWYLTGGSKDGFDMNVQAAWNRGFTGKGITVSILDDGIQTNHPDLLQNYDPRASTDINEGDNDPTPQDNGDNKHGTRCAGEVAATAGNNICGVGVAYNASIGGVRMLDGIVNDAVEAKALGLNPDHIDIYSASWGPEDDGKTVDGPGPLARRAFIYGVSNGRRGLGSIFIWASGNGGRHIDSCNCDGYTNSIFTLSISSATQGGYKPWYLEECSSTLATTYSSGTPTLDKSVATVDMDGRLRPDHICTVEHTGTSASAPLAAGIAALALEANGNLSWRDLQHLVVITSRPSPLEKEEGWYVNGVQRKFSHKFGYGLMDAGAMVDIAVNWAGVPPQHICKSREIREDREIPGSHLGKVKVFMDVDGCSGSNSEIRYLEHVQCKISLRFFPRGNLRIQLTSPMGTTSVLLFERPRDVSSSNFDDWPFLSVHFWGEQAHGRWTLEIINSGSRRINQPGLLKKWQLVLYGTDVNPIRTRGRSLQNPPPPQPSHQTIYQQQRPTSNYGNIPAGHGFQYRPYEPVVTRQYSPPDFLFSGASETQPSQLDRQPKIRTQCQNEYWIPDLSICVNSCPEGYFSNDGSQKECYSCPSRCKTCYNTSSCIACEHNLVLLGTTCVPSCPKGYFETDSSCEPCPLATCATCGGPTGSECVRCQNPFVLHEGKCQQNCPIGFRSTESGICVACPTGCKNCDGNICLQCFNGFVSREDGLCIQRNSLCPAGLFLDNETSQCLGCGSEDCTQCAGNYRCLECQNGLYIFNGNCVSSCLRGSYSGYNERYCFNCPKLCESCNSAEECTSCRVDGVLQGTTCLPHCLDGYFNDIGVCRPCSFGCQTCVASGNSECITCVPGFNYTHGDGCIADIVTQTSSPPPPETFCGDGFWLNRADNTCQPCHRSCSKCGGGNSYNCLSCSHPLKYDRGSSRCIPCCAHENDQDCCHCEGKRHTHAEKTPLTRGYDGECHFVSRRVSEIEERHFESDKLHDSSVVSFFWLALITFVVIFIGVVQYRRKRKQRSLPQYDQHRSISKFRYKAGNDEILNGTKFNGLYAHVNLQAGDDEEEDIRNYHANSTEDDMDSPDEDLKPLVLKT